LPLRGGGGAHQNERVHRANNFDGLRLCAALAVVWSHAFLLSGRAEPMPGPLRSPGHLAVLVFFSISGYLVARSWASDPHPLRFLTRRALRIWPAWAVAVTICGLGALPSVRDDLDVMQAQAWFTNLAFQQVDWQVFRGTVRHDLNGSLWTVPYEVACYVVLAATAPLLGPWRRWACALLLGCLVATFLALGGQHALEAALRDWGRFPWLPYFGAFFLAGMCCFEFGTRYAPAFFAAGVLAIALGEVEMGQLLAIPAISAWVGVRSWPLLRSSGRFGDLSYGLYLWAWPCQQVIVIWLGRQAPLPLLLGTCVACTAVLAWLSWHAIERPALSMKPHRRVGAAPVQRPVPGVTAATSTPDP
jgi:peptidoglycan/LPS O-acetylase OafA/YrhL